jgi:hypothetical protein
MSYPLHARNALAIGLAVFALSGAAAKADVIYTVVTTGTIAGGTSYGTFGAYGASLAGMTFTATQTFDATLSTFSQSGTSYDALSPASSSASITVGGNTYNIAPNTNGDNEYFIASRDGGNSLDGVDSEIDNAAFTAYFIEYIYTSTLTFLSNDSLSQMLFFAPPSSGFINTVIFQAPDSTNFSGTVGTISLNGGVAPAPEPRSIALFGAGLAVLAWLRRRKAA